MVYSESSQPNVTYIWYTGTISIETGRPEAKRTASMNACLNGMCMRESGYAASTASTVVTMVVVPARIKLLRKELIASARPSTSMKLASVSDGSLIAQSGFESMDANTIHSIGRRKKQPSRMRIMLVATAAAETRLYGTTISFSATARRASTALIPGSSKHGRIAARRPPRSTRARVRWRSRSRGRGIRRPAGRRTAEASWSRCPGRPASSRRSA